MVLVFILKLSPCTFIWVPICQGFGHFKGFLHHFVLTKLASSSIRVKTDWFISQFCERRGMFRQQSLTWDWVTLVAAAGFSHNSAWRGQVGVHIPAVHIGASSFVLNKQHSTNKRWMTVLKLNRHRKQRIFAVCLPEVEFHTQLLRI